MIPFGQILQRLRNEKRWSQSKLAEKLGLSASQVANYEIGRRLPSLQILIDMARILGVSTDYLLGVENETKQILDVSDLTSEEISSVSSVIDCFRKSHQKIKYPVWCICFPAESNITYQKKMHCVVF